MDPYIVALSVSLYNASTLHIGKPGDIIQRTAEQIIDKYGDALATPKPSTTSSTKNAQSSTSASNSTPAASISQSTTSTSVYNPAHAPEGSGRDLTASSHSGLKPADSSTTVDEENLARSLAESIRSVLPPGSSVNSGTVTVPKSQPTSCETLPPQSLTVSDVDVTFH